MSKESINRALGKIKSARDCHPNAVDTLLFEVEEILEGVLAEQAAQQEIVQRYSPDGEGAMEIDSFGAWVKFTSPPAQQECRCNQGQVCHVCDPILPAQRKPLTPEFEADTGYSRDERAAFTAGWEAAEAAHGITKGEKP
jgi:hypothetical protein